MLDDRCLSRPFWGGCKAKKLLRTDGPNLAPSQRPGSYIHAAYILAHNGDQYGRYLQRDPRSLFTPSEITRHCHGLSHGNTQRVIHPWSTTLLQPIWANEIATKHAMPSYPPLPPHVLSKTPLPLPPSLSVLLLPTSPSPTFVEDSNSHNFIPAV